MDTAWIALIGTIFGGAGLKGMESFLARGSKKQDAATAIREELRKESAALKEELRTLDKELDAWKDKYFLLLQQYLELSTESGQTVKIPEDKKEEPSW